MTISPEELQQRHAALQEAMETAGYAALIVTGDNDPGHKGFVRWVADLRITDGLVWVIFPLRGEPAMVMNFGSQAYWSKRTGLIRDVHPALDKTAEVAGILVAQGLAAAHIGVVGLEDIIPYNQGKALQEALPGAQFDDATPLLNDLLIPRTAADIARAEETHLIAAQALRRIQESLAPGKTEIEVMADAGYVMAQLGCPYGIARLSTADAGNNRLPGERQFGEEDIVRIYIEAVGPSGYWTELGGVFSFRPPSEFMLRKFNTIARAMGRAAALMRPGVKAGELSAAIEQSYREDGWKIVGRSIWDVHGQGLMGHLPPRAWPGSQDELRLNMILNMHPGVQTEDSLGFALNTNYVVTPAGGRPLGGFKHEWHVV